MKGLGRACDADLQRVQGLGFRFKGLGRACDADLQRVLSALPGVVSDVVGAVARVGHLVEGFALRVQG